MKGDVEGLAASRDEFKPIYENWIAAGGGGGGREMGFEVDVLSNHAWSKLRPIDVSSLPIKMSLCKQMFEG